MTKAKPTITACMMVKNEEELLPQCLDSIKDLVDEIVIVDTGSTDRTVEIAKKYGAIVQVSPWQNDFSLHRNESIELASKGWFLIIDADEVFNKDDHALLKQVLAEASEDTEGVQILVDSVINEGSGTVGAFHSLRVFRNGIGVHYVNAVHNRPVVSGKGPVIRSACRLLHYGYDLDAKKAEKKYQRTKGLLEQQIVDAKDAEDYELLARSHRYLASHLRLRGNNFPIEEVDNIIHHAGTAMMMTDLTKSEAWRTHLMGIETLASAYLFKGEADKAAMFAMRGIHLKRDYLDCYLTAGYAYIQMRAYDEAVRLFNLYIEIQANYKPDCDFDGVLMNQINNVESAKVGLESCREILQQIKENQGARKEKEAKSGAAK